MKLPLILLLLSLVSCTSKEDDNCSSSSSCTDNAGVPQARNVLLKIRFLDTSFYDREKDEFRVITASQFASGNLGERIPVYADFLTKTKNESLGSISISNIQMQSPDAFTVENLNSIPYIAVQAESDVTYIYKYTKLNIDGSEADSATGQFIVGGSVAYLPLVNDMVDDKFCTASSRGSQTNYTHKIQIAAQSANSVKSETYAVTFNSALVIANKDFESEFSEDMQNMTLKTRWNYFYDGSDGTPNPELLLGKMVEKADLSAVSSLDYKDIRVLFKTKPKIEMIYTVFDENSITKDSNAPDANITIVRGYEFYEKSYSLTSDRDFGLIFKINDTSTPLINADKEAVIRNISAGVNWSLTFGYDLNQLPTYPSGKSLLKPLRPICNSITKTSYTPIATSTMRDSVNSLGGFSSVCHPETYQSETVNAASLATFPLEQTDSWYDSFSYMSSKDISNDVHHKRVRIGHLYGIKTIKFKIEGCLKLFTRDASVSPVNPNPWSQKNNESESCSSGPGDEGWMAYSLDREISIFDNVDQYSTTVGLKELINNYNSSVPLNTVDFLFNNDIFFEHIF